MSTRSRADILRELVRFDPPVRPAELSSFPWDSDEELVTVTRDDAIAVLARYTSGHLSAEQVEQWANGIECREDLDYITVAELVDELANPLLSGPLPPDRADEIIRELRTRVI